MQDFRNLKVWHKAHAVVLDVYKVTAEFPKHELYGIVSQIRRAAVSIPNNIAEGCGRGSDADFARFLQMASGSASEVDYLLLLAKDLQLLPAADHGRLATAVAEVGPYVGRLAGYSPNSSTLMGFGLADS